MLFCPPFRRGAALHLQYLNTIALVVLRSCYLQPCSLHFTASATASHHSCCGSRFQSFWSGAFSLLGLGSSSCCFSCTFHGFVPANPDMVVMYFHRRQLPLAEVCPYFLFFLISHFVIWIRETQNIAFTKVDRNNLNTQWTLSGNLHAMLAPKGQPKEESYSGPHHCFLVLAIHSDSFPFLSSLSCGVFLFLPKTIFQH